MTCVMKLINEHETVEIHLLNVGQTFVGFGGSKRGLTARKTASLITRHKAPWGTHDIEYDIDNPRPWKWVEELIAWHGFKLVAAQECEAVSQQPDEVAA